MDETNQEDKRFRNGLRNCKVRQDAECGSDHNPVIATVRIKLKSVQSNKVTAKWNLIKLEDEAYKYEYQRKCEAALKEAQLRKKDDEKTQIREDIESVWESLKVCLTEVADEVCGKAEYRKKQK